MISCYFISDLYLSSPLHFLELQGTILENYPFATYCLILSNPPIIQPLINSCGQVGHFRYYLSQYLIYQSQMMSQQVYYTFYYLRMARRVYVNPHFGFSGVPLIKTIIGQLSRILLIFLCHTFCSFKNYYLCSLHISSIPENISPTSVCQTQNFFRIFLSVLVTITAGVYSTLYFLKVYGHFYAQILKYFTFQFSPNMLNEFLKIVKKDLDFSFQSAQNTITKVVPKLLKRVGVRFLSDSNYWMFIQC